MIWDCWHNQLRLVAKHFPEQMLRAHRSTLSINEGGIFVHVTTTVQNRMTVLSPNILQTIRERGYTVIHIQEPRE